MPAVQAVLVFDLTDPDGTSECKSYMQGPALMGVVWDLDEYLRQQAKYGDDGNKSEWATEMRRHLRQLLIDEGIDIDRG